MWLCTAIGGEIAEVDVPVPEPPLGEMGGVKLLLLPAPAETYSAALLEPELAPALVPVPAVADA